MNAKDIRTRLERFDAPEPSPELLDRIKNEIPEPLPISEETPLVVNRRREGAQWWQMAAAIVLMIGGGWLAWSWTRDPAAPSLTDLAVPQGAPEPLRTIPEEPSTDVAPRATIVDPAHPTADPGVPVSAAVGEREGRADAGSDQPAPRQFPAAKAEPIESAAPAPARPEMAQEAMAQSSNRLKDESARAAESDSLGRAVSGGVVGGVIVYAPPPPAVAAPPAGIRSAAKLRMQEAKRPEPSTGGTAEPNDQPYGDVFFESAGVNPFIDAEDDALSTFGLDVDTGSYTVARRYLADGHLPPPSAIRVEEFLNYFQYGDRAPARDDFALYAEGAPWPFPRGQRYYAVRFGIRAREVSLADRKPATLIFTVDVSGSMNRENRLELVKGTLLMLLDQLGREDRIGLVVYGSNGQVLLEPTSDHDAIRGAIRRLQPGGSTNAEEGLMLAYDLANRHFRRDAINRVILCSDGVANVGRTGPESILDQIGVAARRGIELTTVGFGMGNYNDVLMEQLANRGNGQYAYVDTPSEARRVFVENLTGTLQTIARDAKVQVEFDPRTVASYRLIGYENRDIADDRFRDDTVDAGEIGAGHAVTALYEIKLNPGVSHSAHVATLNLRYKDVDGGDRVVEVDRSIAVRDLHASWKSAPQSLRLATLVATFGEILKDSYWAREVSPQDLSGRVTTLAGDLEDERTEELSALVRRAAPLVESRRRGRDEPDE